MPKTTSLIKLLVLAAALSSLSACGNSSSPAPVTVSAAGQHPANWLTQHYVEYMAQNGGSKGVSGTTQCSECHGSDLAGGISKVSCFTASFNGMTCHANADHTLGHPASWTDPTSSDFHALVSVNGAALKGSSSATIDASCGICHATGTAQTAAAAAGPSCLSTDARWGISCHATSPADTSSGCNSCHGTGASTPAPAGSTAPNRAGAHQKHIDILAQVYKDRPGLTALICATCHTGYFSGTSGHATASFANHSTAFLKLAGAYSAQTGSFSYSAATCAGVSCHGGKTTPAWTGTLPTGDAYCKSCHSYYKDAVQYNSYYSGFYSGNQSNEHFAHLTRAVGSGTGPAACADCHNVNTLTTASHFGGLDSSAMQGAEKTIGPGTVTGLANQTKISAYDAATKTCTNSCHSGGVPNTASWNN